jgi:hypothetical protein
MIDSQQLIQTLKSNLYVIEKQTEGLTHEDSLLQFPFRGNCLNWTVGHIVMHRDYMLKLLGGQPVLNSEETELYAAGSEPITDDSKALRLETLLEHLQTLQQRLVAALEKMTPEDLAVIVESDERKRSLGQMLSGLGWHETYYAGHTDIQRQLAGKNDQVF